MLNKKIANIVFYKVPNGAEEIKQATIFYADGTVKNVNFEEGIDACEQIVQERHIQTKDAFREMINRDIVHVVSAKEFRDNFYRYVPETINTDRNEMGINREETMHSTGAQTPVEEHNEVSNVVPIHTAVPSHEENGDIDNVDVFEDTNEEEAEEEVVAEETNTADPVVPASTVAPAFGAAAVPNGSYRTPTSNTSDSDDTSDVVEEVDEENHDEMTPEENEDAFDGADDFDPEIEDTDSIDEDTNSDDPTRKEGFFKRAWKKIKSNKIVKRVLLCVTALAVALGIYSCSQKKSLEGEMFRSNIPGITDLTDDNNNTNTTMLDGVYYDDDGILLQDELVLNTHFYDDASINSLLRSTHNQTQKTAMYNLGLAMDGFNNEFASHYIEEGKDVRAALKFDEVAALQVAYNDYSKEQLKAYFNGGDIRGENLTRAYKDASLQLMGAYAMESPEHSVDMSMLIESEEGKAFYNRYHQAFLAAKEASGDDKIRLVTEFYKMVRADFPIGEKARTEGISHAQNYDELEAYKLSVTPMIAAAEMMWQNLQTDVTLQDGEIDFLNDLGLCNFAQKTFERAELVSLTSETDKKNPTYEQYKDAYIKYYTDKGIYYVDDAHRELTELDAFQDAVNWHIRENGAWVWQGSTWTETETHTEVETHTETETTYHEEVTETPVDESDVPEDVREDLQQQVDADIERENEEARRRAEEAAEAERQRLQAIEDQQAAEVQQEVLQDEQDLQDTIDDANEQIEQNQDSDSTNDEPINEDDLGHGIDFDDEHSDEQGNLDSSVENITTDSTGDMTNQPLPDPEDTGKEFDARSYDASATTTVVESAPESKQETASTQTFVESEEPIVTQYSEDQWVESVPASDGSYQETAWVEEEPYEAAVDSYVESMASGDYGSNLAEEDVDSYEYTK